MEAYSAGSAGNPDWGAARIITSYKTPDDAISPQLRTWAARRGKEEVELHQARAKIRQGRTLLATTDDAAAGAVADGALPAGGPPKPRPKKGARNGLEAPAQQ